MKKLIAGLGLTIFAVNANASNYLDLIECQAKSQLAGALMNLHQVGGDVVEYYNESITDELSDDADVKAMIEQIKITQVSSSKVMKNKTQEFFAEHWLNHCMIKLK